MSQSGKYASYLQELLSATYLGLLIVQEEAWKVGSPLLGMLGFPLTQYLYPLLPRFRHLSRPGILVHTAILWFLLVIIIFVSLQALGLVSAIRKFLLYGAGVVVIAGYPLIWLRLGNLTGWSPVVRGWLLLEAAVLVLCVLLYILKLWPSNPALSIAVLLLHFGLWGWITLEKFSNGFWWLYLLLGIVSIVSWGIAVATTSRTMSVPART